MTLKNQTKYLFNAHWNDLYMKTTVMINEFVSEAGIPYDMTDKALETYKAHMTMGLIDGLNIMSATNLAQLMGHSTHSSVNYARRRMNEESNLYKKWGEKYKKLVLAHKAVIKPLLEKIEKRTTYIDMNNCTSFKFGQGKAIVFVGFDPEEVKPFHQDIFPAIQPFEHYNTGIVLKYEEKDSNSGESICNDR